MNPTPSPHDDDPLVQSLRGLSPSATPLDPAVVFYRMGLAAGSRKGVRTLFSAAAALLLAASLSAVVSAPVGYRLGRASTGALEQTTPNAMPPAITGPLLTQSDTEFPIESNIAEASTVSSAASASKDTDSVAIAATSLHQPDATPLAWPRFHAVMTAWLLGDALGRPLTESAEPTLLTHRLISGRGEEDLLAEQMLFPRSPRAGVTRQPSKTAGHDKDSPQTSPAAKGYSPLRANDWKEVIDLKELF